MSKGYYKVTLNVSKYTGVGDSYQHVTVSKTMTFRYWDEVQNLLGAIVEGSDDKTIFAVEFIREEETDERETER